MATFIRHPLDATAVAQYHSILLLFYPCAWSTPTSAAILNRTLLVRGAGRREQQGRFASQPANLRDGAAIAAQLFVSAGN